MSEARFKVTQLTERVTIRRESGSDVVPLPDLRVSEQPSVGLDGGFPSAFPAMGQPMLGTDDGLGLSMDNEPSLMDEEALGGLQTYEDGLRDGQAQAEELHKRTVEVMEKTLDALKVQYTQVVKDIERSHLSAIIQCLETMMPSLMDQHMRQEVERVVSLMASGALEGPFRVEVSEGIEQDVRQFLGAHGEEFDVVTSQELEGRDVKIGWTQGGFEYSADKVREACLSQLNTVLQHMNEGSYE